MLDLSQMQRLVGLQEKSYQMFRWINQKLIERGFRFDRIHGAISMADAAEEWIERHNDSVPVSFRPSPDDRAAFARLLASYMATSFEVRDKLHVSDGGCCCDWCNYVVNIRHLRARKPSRKAKASATKLKEIALRQLADELGLAIQPDELAAMIDDPTTTIDVSWLSYGRELQRRAEFASQGEGVLVLWREIAWLENGRLNPKFQLKPQRFIDAQKHLTSWLSNIESTEGPEQKGS